MSEQWRYQQFPENSLAQHAQRFAALMEAKTIALDNSSSNHRFLRWPDVLDAFVAAGDAAIEEHVRRQQEKGAKINKEEADFPIESSYYWAQRLMTQQEAGPRSFEAIADEFQGAMAAAVDEYVRNHRERVTWGDASEGTSDSPEEAHETPHRIPAQSIIVRFMNGAEEIIHCHHPMVAEGGWTFRNLNDIPYLVIGHGVPRRQYPLCNIAFIELSPELL